MSTGKQRRGGRRVDEPRGSRLHTVPPHRHPHPPLPCHRCPTTARSAWLPRKANQSRRRRGAAVALSRGSRRQAYRCRRGKAGAAMRLASAIPVRRGVPGAGAARPPRDLAAAAWRLAPAGGQLRSRCPRGILAARQAHTGQTIYIISGARTPPRDAQVPAMMSGADRAGPSRLNLSRHQGAADGFVEFG